MSVCAFNSLPKGKYSNFFIAAGLYRNLYLGKTVLLVQNSYLLTFPDYKADILVICLSKS